MCGRYALTSPSSAIAERFGLAWAPDVPPHYNIAPSQPIPVVRETGQGRELALLKWGLIPSWAKDASIGMKLINARGETLGDKPAFRNAYRHRHCLVPTDAFYEWKPVAGRKQPYCIRMRDQALFGMAGLWEHWVAPDGQVVESYHRHGRRQRPGGRTVRPHAAHSGAGRLRCLAGRQCQGSRIAPRCSRRRHGGLPGQPPGQQRAERRPGVLDPGRRALRFRSPPWPQRGGRTQLAKAGSLYKNTVCLKPL